MPESRSLRRLLCVLAALALGACGGAGAPAQREVTARPDPAHPAELLVEVLPPGAQVFLDGRALGSGGRAVPAPPPGPHVLRVEAEGYEASEQPLPEGALAGARVGAALRPSGFDGARVVELDAADSLAQVAAHLARRGGRPQDAIAYAERAIALEPRTALAHRALGDARAVLGDGRRAAASWAEYLKLAPGAPDAPAVANRIEGTRADVAVPAR